MGEKSWNDGLEHNEDAFEFKLTSKHGIYFLKVLLNLTPNLPLVNLINEK